MLAANLIKKGISSVLLGIFIIHSRHNIQLVDCVSYVFLILFSPFLEVDDVLIDNLSF